MNPFTKFLRQWSNDREFGRFISYWDRLETLILMIYRDEIDRVEAEAEFNNVWPWLRQAYGRFQSRLEPYWCRTLVAGQPVKSDPFRFLLDLPGPAAITDNWPALQHLPAAREAINTYLGDRPSA